MNEVDFEKIANLKKLEVLFKNEVISKVFLNVKDWILVAVLLLLISAILRNIYDMDNNRILNTLSIICVIMFSAFAFTHSNHSLKFLIHINFSSRANFYMNIIKYTKILVYNCIVVFGMMFCIGNNETSHNSIMKSCIERLVYCIFFICSVMLIIYYPSLYCCYGYNVVKIIINVYLISMISLCYYYIYKKILILKRYINTVNNK